MSDAEYCAAVGELLETVVEQHREQIERLPKDWRRRILSRVPTARPERTKRGPRVLVHAASKRARLEFREMLKFWLKQYWGASERLRAGCWEAIRDFPANAFPPTLPGKLVVYN